MKTLPPLKPNPLIDQSKPWTVARFTHLPDGSTRTFYSGINEMSGNRLSAFGSDTPSINEPVSWVQTVLRDILAKASNVEIIGTIKPAKPKK